jgi:hypothetical protein
MKINLAVSKIVSIFILLNNKTTEIMDEKIMKHYYQGEVNKIDFHSEFPARIKIEGDKEKTKWMDLNEISARVIVEKLIEQFNLDAE